MRLTQEMRVKITSAKSKRVEKYCYLLDRKYTEFVGCTCAFRRTIQMYLYETSMYTRSLADYFRF